MQCPRAKKKKKNSGCGLQGDYVSKAELAHAKWTGNVTINPGIQGAVKAKEVRRAKTF